MLVLGRIAVRKGVEDVIAVAQLLRERGVRARVRVVGGPSLWSDYTKLLDELPSENAEYAGRVPPSEIPAELARCDVLLQASKYEPFALTVAEALAAGVPVVATSAVGAIEGVDRSVVTALEPGDVEGMASAITAMLERQRTEREQIRASARAEAARLFAPEVVCAPDRRGARGARRGPRAAGPRARRRARPHQRTRLSHAGAPGRLSELHRSIKESRGGIR